MVFLAYFFIGSRRFVYLFTKGEQAFFCFLRGRQNMSLVVENQSITTTKTIHHVLIHPKPFQVQPKGWQMGKITNDLKKSYAEPVSIKYILEMFAKGHSIMLSNAEIDHNNNFRFLSSRLFAIDIDDDDQITNPIEVLNNLKNQAVGLFYTFSHGIKGNRYRLVFQLDQTITDQTKMRSIIALIAKRLRNEGLPVDTQATNPLQIVRGGKSYSLINETNTLNTARLLEEIKQNNLQRQKELYDAFEKELRPIPFDVLKKMAEAVGHIPSGIGDGERWNRLANGIKHYANLGFITQDEGFELYDIISGGEQTQKQWENRKPNGQATIGSLVHEAKERGFKSKFNYFANDVSVKKEYCEEVIKVNKYLTTEIAKDLLTRNTRILVDSPTGAGKTTSFLNAFKELNSTKKHFFIFAAPTIALTMQIKEEHKVFGVTGDTKNLFEAIVSYIKSGNRIFVCTYDMTPIVLNLLKKIEKNITFSLVIDEMHKFVFDYNYRFEAINNLYHISKQAKAMIGLSGTVDDIYKNEFDMVVKIDNGKPKSPCGDVAVYTYDKKKNALVELAELISVWTSDRKLLIFIQSLKTIHKLNKVLERKKINTKIITANSKSNETFKQIVDNRTIDQEVQVVLTTTVIADGVSIDNDINWEVIAVTNDFSNLFNYSAIKQISNRLRNPYLRFSLYMQEPKNEDHQIFNLESAFQFKKETAERITAEINKHAFFDPKLFYSSVIERNYGIYQSIDGDLQVDTLHLRHHVSRDQEKYYAGYRFAFIEAVEKALHQKIAGILNISKAIREKNLDTSLTAAFITKLEEQELIDKKKKVALVGKKFTQTIYQAFRREEEEVLREFKREVTDFHFACLQRLTTIADYFTCRQIITQVSRHADTHKFYNSIINHNESVYLLSVHRPNKTRDILLELLRLDEWMQNSDFERELELIAKHKRTTLKDVKDVLKKMVVVETKRQKSARFTRVVSTPTPKIIADMYDLQLETVIKIILNHASTKSKAFGAVIGSFIKRSIP